MNFPDLFDRFADRVLPANLTDAAILQLRHEAYAEDLPPGGRLHLDDDRSHFIFVGSGATKLAATTFVAGVVVGWSLNRMLRHRLREWLRNLQGSL